MLVCWTARPSVGRSARTAPNSRAKSRGFSPAMLECKTYPLPSCKLYSRTPRNPRPFLPFAIMAASSTQQGKPQARKLGAHLLPQGTIHLHTAPASDFSLHVGGVGKLV